MPPRRSARSVSGTVPPPPAAKSIRSRKSAKAATPPEDEVEDVGFPGESDDDQNDDVEEEAVIQPKARRSAGRGKSVEVKKEPRRRSARETTAVGEEEEAEAEEEEEEEEEVVKPAKGRGRKPAARVASKATSRGKKIVVEEEEEEREDGRDETPRPVDKEATPTPATLTVKAEPTADGAEEEDEDATPAPPNRQQPVDDEESEEDLEDTLRHDVPPIPATPLTSSLPPPPPQPTGPKPRLTIHKLVLVNFKSYADRQEIGPFHKSFSAIVGPNGSGKSNTIDALLFVFGYRASKMRQGKLSELIHVSAGKEGIESCSVEVWFREIVDQPGVDNFLLVPNSQLVVTRTAYRNNSSKYTINDRTSSFTEVTTLLKGKGIDLDHNRFLILQGEVESIAQMKAKAQNEHEDGLLEYLEDIIGTTRYKQPIEEANQEVEALNEARGEKMNRLRVVEREKGALEEKKREAEDFLRDSNELTRKKSLLWQFHMHTLNNNIEITTKAIEKLTAQLAEEQEANGHHLQEIDELQKGYEEKLAAFEEVKRLTDALVKDAKKFEKEEVGLLEKKKHLAGKYKKMKKALTDDGHARSEALAAIENYGAELEANRSKVAGLEKKLEVEEAELEEIRDSLKDKTDVFTSQIETAQRELEPWTAKINEKQSAIDVATSERDALTQKAEGLQQGLEEARETLEGLREGGKEKRREWDALKKEEGEVRRKLDEGEKKLEAMSRRGEDLRGKATASRQKADEAKASMAKDKSENAVLASLNKLKAQGRIKGFHGRLGDLGVIDDKYDIAVTTACGALNNLVVDTVEQGQACIEHLRKSNIGRASFMVLEKLPPRDLGPIETPEGVPRLFDLIKPQDPKFAPAFYKGVFNTLVADDLVQAQRIGYGKKRWRVVTLQGQLIDPSGTMSGGGQKVSRGGMSSKFASSGSVGPDVVARYEKDVEVTEEEVRQWTQEKKALEEEVKGLRKRLPEVEVGVEKVELDVRGGEKRLEEAERRLKELQSQSKPDAADEQRIKTLNAEIATLSRDLEKLRAKTTTISNTIKDLQNKILEVGGVKLRAIQSKVSTTKGLLDLANESITKAEVGLAKAERDVAKLEKAIASNEEKMGEIDGEVKEVDGDLEGCQRDLGVIREKVAEAEGAVEDGQEVLGESKAELDEKMKEINEFRKIEVEIQNKIEDNVKVQKDSKEKFKHWRKRHDELELAHVDEEDEEEEEVPAVDGDVVAEGEGSKSKKSKAETTELVEYSPDELRSVDKEMLNAEITQLEEEIAKMKPNLTVLAEYRKREAEFLDRAKDMESVTTRRDDAKKRYDELRKVRLDEFMSGFSAISSKLKEMYQMITMGGNAEIELIDSMDPFSEGVVLSIMPPKKSWRAIANLSGGEKTLASLALVFALHVFKPTPLYFMDEIDAALDFKNVSIVANYIQSKTQAAQFIVISLRNDMFELAHRLVGIYKTSNCTKSIAIDNKDLRTQAVVPKPRRPLATPQTAHRPTTPGTATVNGKDRQSVEQTPTPAVLA